MAKKTTKKTNLTSDCKEQPVVFRSPKSIHNPILLELRAGGTVKIISTGEQLSLYPGKYSLKGVYIPTPLKKIPIFGFAYDEPRVKVDCEITVKSGKGEYTVPVIYDCWELILDKAVDEKYKARTIGGDSTEVECLTDRGDEANVYVWLPGASARGACDIICVPKDGEESVHRIKWNGSPGVEIENGKWYKFSGGEILSGKIK